MKGMSNGGVTRAVGQQLEDNFGFVPQYHAAGLFPFSSSDKLLRDKTLLYND